MEPPFSRGARGRAERARADLGAMYAFRCALPDLLLSTSAAVAAALFTLRRVNIDGV